MKKISLFDSNCMVGVWKENLGTSLITAQAMQDHMDYFCIDEALIHHSLSVSYNQLYGNDMLNDFTEKIPRLSKRY